MALYSSSCTKMFYKNADVLKGYLKKFPNSTGKYLCRASVTDSCREVWNVRNCSAWQVEILGIDEAYKIGDGWNVWNLTNSLWSLNMNTAEFSFSQLEEPKICVTSETHVDVVALVVWVVSVCVWLFGMYESSYAIIQIYDIIISFIKLSWIGCRCGLKKNSLNFVLSPLYLIYMRFLLPSVIKLGCKRCTCWKR